jgi:hypothetical protein
MVATTEVVSTAVELEEPDVMPVEGKPGEFYVRGSVHRDGQQWWYWCFIGDSRRLPRCECKHHQNRLLGTNVPCRHLKRARQLMDEQKRQLMSGCERRQERPDPAWIRGECPVCGDAVVSNCYLIHGKGWIIVWECWSSLADEPECDYRRVI